MRVSDQNSFCLQGVNDCCQATESLEGMPWEAFQSWTLAASHGAGLEVMSTPEGDRLLEFALDQFEWIGFQDTLPLDSTMASLELVS